MGTVNIPNSGIGGGGFAVVRLINGATRSFNFREMAPQAAHQNMFAGKTPLPNTCVYPPIWNTWISHIP